jgi:hypothetical protein
VNVQGRNLGPFVVPMISNAVTLTLGADGSLRDARLSASSTSDTADSLVLAAVRRAGAANAFPRVESRSVHADTITADLVVSIAEPAPGDQVVALGRLDAPAWPSVSGAQLTDLPSLPTDLLRVLMARDPGADTSALEFVVSDQGVALPATLRVGYSGAGQFFATDRERRSALREFRFTAGRIAGCRVPEFVRYNTLQGTSPRMGP